MRQLRAIKVIRTHGPDPDKTDLSKALDLAEKLEAKSYTTGNPRMASDLFAEACVLRIKALELQKHLNKGG